MKRGLGKERKEKIKSVSLNVRVNVDCNNGVSGEDVTVGD